MKSIHAVLFSLYISCIWWSLSVVFAAGRKSNGRFAFKPLGRFIASPRFTFFFLARQIGAFPFPLRLLYDKVLCGLYVAMYHSTFLLFIYLFILTADGFKPPLSNNPPHRQYRKKYFRSSVENSINALISSRFLPISANGLVSKTAFR